MRAKNDLFECQRVAIVLAALVLVGSSRPAFSDDVDDYLRSEMAKRHIPGLSVAVVRDARTVTIRNYGFSNIELGVPVTSESVFKLASVTKPFTATAVMMLVEEGKISLDEPIARYVPELPFHWRAATVRQILSHTSGIADYLRAPRWSWQSSWRLNLTPREVVQFASESPLDFGPGTQIRYSNTGYYLLGLLIERVSGKPYEQFLRERIFQPLQMTSTRRDRQQKLFLIEWMDTSSKTVPSKTLNTPARLGHIPREALFPPPKIWQSGKPQLALARFSSPQAWGRCGLQADSTTVSLESSEIMALANLITTDWAGTSVSIAATGSCFIPATNLDFRQRSRASKGII
jgi:CubicO group peptidase (beta-lactamase class C family)